MHSADKASLWGRYISYANFIFSEFATVKERVMKAQP
jgi:hypothetical protein